MYSAIPVHQQRALIWLYRRWTLQIKLLLRKKREHGQSETVHRGESEPSRPTRGTPSAPRFRFTRALVDDLRNLLLNADSAEGRGICLNNIEP